MTVAFFLFWLLQLHFWLWSSVFGFDHFQKREKTTRRQKQSYGCQFAAWRKPLLVTTFGNCLMECIFCCLWGLQKALDLGWAHLVPEHFWRQEQYFFSVSANAREVSINCNSQSLLTSNPAISPFWHCLQHVCFVRHPLTCITWVLIWQEIMVPLSLLCLLFGLQARHVHDAILHLGVELNSKLVSLD